MNHPVGTRDNPHRVVLAKARQTGNRPVFSVTYDGQVIVESADPEFAACRALKAMGLTGRLVTRWQGSSHDAMSVDIKRGAQLSTSDGASAPPRFIKFAPMAPDSVQKLQRLSQDGDLVGAG